MSFECSDIETILITKEEADASMRLDKILALRFSHQQSRTYFQWLIENGLVLLNNQPIKKRIIPKEGDEVEIHWTISPEIELTPENIPLDIIYEDSHLLIINKPVGMVVHPAPGNWNGTFVNGLLHYLKDDRFYSESAFNRTTNSHPGMELRPGIVHRLDKDTTGLLIAAKNLHCQQRLITMFAERKIYKEYYALCLGNVGNGLVEEPIGRHPKHRQMMCVARENGKHAFTEFKGLAKTPDNKISLVKLNLKTGRTHQIRVHMKHLGYPILGDELYGNIASNRHFGALRQMLHAKALKFEHPITCKQMEFNAPMKRDMLDFVEKCTVNLLPL